MRMTKGADQPEHNYVQSNISTLFIHFRESFIDKLASCNFFYYLTYPLPPPPPPPLESGSHGKSQRLPRHHLMFGHHQPVSQPAKYWWADDGPLLVLFGSSIPSSTKKNSVRVGPTLTKLSGSAHVSLSASAEFDFVNRMSANICILHLKVNCFFLFFLFICSSCRQRFNYLK